MSETGQHRRMKGFRESVYGYTVYRSSVELIKALPTRTKNEGEQKTQKCDSNSYYVGR